MLKILFIGDIVGKPGRQISVRMVPRLRKELGLALVVANAENGDGAGAGLLCEDFQALINCGIDCITMGDHIYRKKELYAVLENDQRIVKPANFPAEAPGKTWTVVPAADGTEVAVFSLLGRVFMRPVDCPFRTAETVLAEIPENVKVRLLDFHAEATSDMQLMGRILDARVSAVLGTHTHVPTADEQIFPGGTAFQCDVGMTGPHESIIGRKIKAVWETTLTFRPTHFQVAKEDVRINGALVEIDPATGLAQSISRLCVRDDDRVIISEPQLRLGAADNSQETN